MLEFHHNLVTLPSHHSNTTRESFHIVCTISQTVSFVFSFTNNEFSFNFASQLINTTYE
ncbi:MAG: hypothetical protein Q8S84_06425 [bacterium]|nr:hypothetical protein [bacterium]